eukprot:11003216-Alexandrium_andersonii.AAC.1
MKASARACECMGSLVSECARAPIRMCVSVCPPMPLCLYACPCFPVCTRVACADTHMPECLLAQAEVMGRTSQVTQDLQLQTQHRASTPHPAQLHVARHRGAAHAAHCTANML